MLKKPVVMYMLGSVKKVVDNLNVKWLQPHIEWWWHLLSWSAAWCIIMTIIKTSTKPTLHYSKRFSRFDTKRLIERCEGFFLRANETLKNLIGPSKKGQNSAETSKNFFTMEYGRLIDHLWPQWASNNNFRIFYSVQTGDRDVLFPKFRRRKKHLETHSCSFSLATFLQSYISSRVVHP